MKKFLGIIVLTGAATLFSAGEAMAIPISGAIELSGGVDSSTLTNLTEVNFTTLGLVNVVTGDLAAMLGFGSTVTMTDIVIAAPGTIWSGGGFSFTATSYTAPMVNVAGGKDFTATGVLMGAGFDDTPGYFTFSSNASLQNTASFSSSTSNVPEPATLALLGVGLLGAGFAGRRRKGQA